MCIGVKHRDRAGRFVAVSDEHGKMKQSVTLRQREEP